MLIFSVHLKGTKESDVVGWESGSGDFIPGLLVWQRIQFIAKQILLVNSSSSSSSLWLKRCTSQNIFYLFKTRVQFWSDLWHHSLSWRGPSSYFTSARVKIFISPRPSSLQAKLNFGQRCLIKSSGKIFILSEFNLWPNELTLRICSCSVKRDWIKIKLWQVIFLTRL